MTSTSIPLTVPKNGAVMVKKAASHDVAFLHALTDGVQLAARQQEAAGEDVDDVERSTFQGTYDWRTYLAEELSYVKHRMRTDGGFP